MPAKYAPRTLDSDPHFMLLLSCVKNNSGTIDWEAVGENMDLSAMACKARLERLIKAQNSAGEGGAGQVAGMKARALTKVKKRVAEVDRDIKRFIKRQKLLAKEASTESQDGNSDQEGGVNLEPMAEDI